MAADMWHRSCGSRYVATDMWQRTCGSGHVAADIWHRTCGIGHVSTDLSQRICGNGLILRDERCSAQRGENFGKFSNILKNNISGSGAVVRQFT